MEDSFLNLVNRIRMLRGFGESLETIHDTVSHGDLGFTEELFFLAWHGACLMDKGLDGWPD